MSFKYTKRDLRQANLLDGPEFDLQYNEYKGVLNGGLDHMNLPSKNGAITDSHVVRQSFLRWTVSSNQLASLNNEQIHMSDAYSEVKQDPAGGANPYYTATTMDVYQGQWIDNDQAITIDTQEGMLQVFFNCWYWMNADLGEISGTPWVEFRLQLDDNTIAFTGRNYRTRGNCHMVATVPVAQMTGARITLGWRFPGPKDGATKLIPMMWFDGGTMFALNRFR
jgi:hypothetical protein